MNMFEVFLWIIFPYTVPVIFTIGLVWRCDISELYKDDKRFNRKFKFSSWAVKGFLFLSVSTGVAVVLFNGIGNDSIKLFQWVVSVVLLHPDMELIGAVSVFSRMHIIVLLTFLLMISCTRYVNYLFNPFLLYKKLNVKISHE